jgi:TolA-binding protein
MFSCQAVQTAARAAFVILVSLALNACGGDLPGVISGSGAAPQISPDSSAEDKSPATDEQLYEEGLAAFNAAEAAAQAGSIAEAGAKYLEAQVLFDRLWSEYPLSRRHDNAGYLRGRCRYELGDQGGAIAALEEMRARHPDSSLLDNAAYYIGRSYYEAGELANARAALSNFETAYPGSVYLDNGRYYLGRSFFDAGLYAEALGPLERVLLTTGSSFEDDARFYHARCLYHLGDFRAAVPEFENLIALFPAGQYADNALLFEMRSSIALGSCPDAETALTRLTTNYPASLFITQAQTDFNAGCS